MYERCLGELAEWFKALVLKTSDPVRDRGFESLILRIECITQDDHLETGGYFVPRAQV